MSICAECEALESEPDKQGVLLMECGIPTFLQILTWPFVLLCVLGTASACEMAKSLIDHAQQLNIRWRIAIGAGVLLLILLFTSSDLDVECDGPAPSESKSPSLLENIKSMSPASDWTSNSAHSLSLVSIFIFILIFIRSIPRAILTREGRMARIESGR